MAFVITASRCIGLRPLKILAIEMYVTQNPTRFVDATGAMNCQTGRMQQETYVNDSRSLLIAMVVAFSEATMRPLTRAANTSVRNKYFMAGAFAKKSGRCIYGWFAVDPMTHSPDRPWTVGAWRTRRPADKISGHVVGMIDGRCRFVVGRMGTRTGG